MKRKVVALMLAVVMCLSLAACGSKEAASSEQTGESSASEEVGEAQEETVSEESGEATAEEADPVEDTKSSIEKAQEERASAAIKDVEIQAEEIPDNEAMSFVQNMKAGWNLGNSLEAYNSDWTPENELLSEESWGNPITTKEMIDEIKKVGFETVRIPVTWHNHVIVAEDGTMTVSEAWLDRVQEVVDYAFDNDMYVILNTHHDIDMESGYYPSSAYYEQSEKFLVTAWTAMAERFKDYDEHLIFESINEPRLVGSSYEWNFQASVAECQDAADCINRFNQVFVDTIRATGGNNAERYLMMPGYAASLAGVTTDLYQLPVDTAENKLIVSVHAYTPYNFALQSASESGSTDVFSIDSAASTGDIDSMMSQLYNKFTSQGIPVIIGEYGARDKDNNLQDRLDYYTYYVAAARARGITCCVWDNNAFSGNGENFGLFRRRVCSWLYPEIVEAILKYA